jgi:hypothetical protein
MVLKSSRAPTRVIGVVSFANGAEIAGVTRVRTAPGPPTKATPVTSVIYRIHLKLRATASLGRRRLQPCRAVPLGSGVPTSLDSSGPMGQRRG